MTTFIQWLRSFPWLRQRDLPCIISPDLDGIACGLLQAHVLGWRVVGTYDGTDLCLFEAPMTIEWTSVVFIDVEILRAGTRSIGNHLLALDSHDSQRLKQEFPSCANPNIWRGINVRESFQQKYPFGTLPLLLAAVVDCDAGFSVNAPWLGLILHTDSSFTNAATYQANALDWLEAMAANGDSHGIKRLCERLRRLSALQALHLLEEVQSWVAKAGFGKKQRACRFKPFEQTGVTKAMDLAERIATETGVAMTLSLNNPLAHREEFGTAKLPLDSKGKQQSSFQTAKVRRVISMAATGQTPEGLSVTYPNVGCEIAALL